MGPTETTGGKGPVHARTVGLVGFTLLDYGQFPLPLSVKRMSLRWIVPHGHLEFHSGMRSVCW